MSEQQFKIFRSSAGSGKTWQLAFHYVVLALQSPGNFRNILAVTFTNKATAEMKERIIEFLQELSGDIRSPLRLRMCSELDINEEDVRLRARTALEDIVHHYSHFSVSTIDAFFQTIIRGFAREIGMLGNYTIEMDVGRVRDEAVDMTLADAGIDKNLTKWLVDFAGTRLDSGESWDIRKNLTALSRELFTEQYRRIQPEVLPGKRSGAIVRSLYSELLQLKRRYEARLRQHAEEALRIMEETGLRPEDVKWGMRGPGGFFGKIIASADTEINSYVRRAAERREGWHRKGTDTAPIEAALDRGLLRVLRELLLYMDEQATMYRSVKHFLRYIHSYALLTEIRTRLEQYRAEKGIMLISDVNAFLRGIISNNDAPFIYEKTGNRYRHFLIDEFQDTSVFQWDNFKPLIENSLAQGYQNLVVGDGKQSIYRWRSGEWELLNNHIPDVFGSSITSVTTLGDNYRSAPDIVAFNNLLFSKLPSILQGLFVHHADAVQGRGEEGNDIDRLTSNFSSLYSDAGQTAVKSGVSGTGGLVHLSFHEQNENTDAWRKAILSQLEQRIEEVLATGYQPADIAVLVRNREEGKEVVQHLMMRETTEGDRNYDVVSNESLYLGNAHAVRIVINGLRYMANPADMLALASLRYEYFLMSHEPGEDPGALFSGSSDPGADDFVQDFDAALEGMKQEHIPEQIEAMIRFFRLDARASNAAYLMGLQDAVYGYLNENPEGPAAFFTWWEEQGQFVSVQVPDALDAVQVLTIHRSKGLQFPVVMLPFCNWSLDHNQHHDNFIWTKSPVKPFDRAGYFPLRYGKALARTFFIHDYLEELGKVFIDNLNLLYVAFTRAENALFADCKMPATDDIDLEKVRDVSDLLYFYFSREKDALRAAALWSAECVVEDRECSIGMLPPPAQPVPRTGVRRFDGYHSFLPGDRIRVRRRADDIFGAEWKSRIDYGNLAHQVLSEISSERDIEDALRRLRDEGKLTMDELADLRDRIAAIFSIPEVRSWFSGGWTSYTEMPILTRSGRQWKPDRVLVNDSKALVIDYKTGAEDEAHKTQVQRYRQLLSEMGYRDIEAYLLYISNKKVVRVV